MFTSKYELCWQDLVLSASTKARCGADRSMRSSHTLIYKNIEQSDACYSVAVVWVTFLWILGGVQAQG
jgi:hypothetical protein